MEEYADDFTITLMYYENEATGSGIIEISRVPICNNLLDEPLKDPWFFNRLCISEKLRNKGVATLMMKRLIEILDEKRIDLINTVNPYGDLNEEELIKFYKKFGFTNGSSKEFHENLLIRKAETI